MITPHASFVASSGQCNENELDRLYNITEARDAFTESHQVLMVLNKL